MSNRQMAHRIATVRLEAEAFGDLAREQVACHIFAARGDSNVSCLERRQPIRVDVCENTRCGAKLQERNVFALGDRARQLRLHLDDIRIGEPSDQVNIVNRQVDHDTDIRHARRKRADTSDRN